MRNFIGIFFYSISLFLWGCNPLGGSGSMEETFVPGAIISTEVENFTVTSSVSTTVAGVTQIFTIVAKDKDNATLSKYAGTISISTADAQAEISNSNLTFNEAMSGQAQVTIKFKTSGVYSVQVTEQAVLFPATGELNNFSVTPASLKNFQMNTVSSTTAGQSQSLTLIAQDEFANTVTNYTGTVQISNTDAAGVFVTSTVFSAPDAGIKNLGYELRTSGNQKFTTVDLAVAGSSSDSSLIAVAAGSPTQALLSGVSTSVTAGSNQSATLTLKDIYNNTANNFVGAFSITSTDASAFLPANINFTAPDVGQKSFNYELRTADVQKITVSNISLSLSTDSSNITVSPATPSATTSTLVLSPTTNPADHVATSTITVTLKDAYGNSVPNLAVTVGSSGTDSITQPSTNTNASGVTTGSIKSLETGVKTISVSAPTGLTSVNNTITFTAPVLSAPQNLTLTGRGGEKISPAISWSAPSQVGMGIDHYEVAIGTTSGASNVLSWSTVPGGSAATGYTIQNAVDSFSLNLNYETNYYLSLRAVDTATTTSSAETASWQITWTPRAFGSSLKFWFDGTDNATITLDGSQRASQWTDKSNNNFVVSQSTAASRPTQENLANGKGFTFDTTGKKLVSSTTTALLDTDGFTSYFVQKTAATGNWRALLSTISDQNFALYSTYSGTAYRFYNGAHSTTSLQDTSVVEVSGYIAIPSGNFIDRRSGSEISSASIAATTYAASSFAIGNYSIANQTGTGASTIGEVIVLETNANVTAYEKIEGYLSHKWGLQSALPPGHTYKNGPP